jgi:hypothetical protein
MTSPSSFLSALPSPSLIFLLVPLHSLAFLSKKITQKKKSQFFLIFLGVSYFRKKTNFRTDAAYTNFSGVQRKMPRAPKRHGDHTLLPERLEIEGDHHREAPILVRRDGMRRREEGEGGRRREKERKEGGRGRGRGAKKGRAPERHWDHTLLT